MIRRPPRSTLVERRRQRQMCIRDRYYTLLLYFLKMVYGWMSVQPHFFGREKISFHFFLCARTHTPPAMSVCPSACSAAAAAGRVRTPPAMSVCPSACLSRVVCAREKKNAKCPENFAAGEGGMHRHPMHRRKQQRVVCARRPRCLLYTSDAADDAPRV